ncbi:MAG TPA: hypothetical protein VFO14_17495 [Vicinamibacterales bacterium]|nr:hypothetical protein [Vicinamibacterales bacterium]
MNTLIHCIRREYQEMPGLALTLPQAERLWGVDEDRCRAALEALVASKFLTLRNDGRFARRDAWDQGWCPWCGVAA